MIAIVNPPVYFNTLSATQFGIGESDEQLATERAAKRRRSRIPAKTRKEGVGA